MKLPACLMLVCWALTMPLLAQDPDLEADEQAAIEAIYRSSDEPGEVPTGAGARRRNPKRVSVPKGAERVGCICMDDSPSKTHSSGACSGHGGVRYWLYKTLEGDTARVLTERHERHPHPLTEAERSELAQIKPKGSRRTALEAGALAPVVVMQPTPMQPWYPPAPVGDTDTFTWSHTVAVGFAGIVLYAGLRHLLSWLERNPNLARYALRHLLRYRKRPTARKDGKGPAAPRR